MNMKCLVLRLSSLGDVVLASSVLEVDSFTTSRRIDWVVAKEFKEVLSNHPRIQRLWVFDRSGGFRAWIQYCRKLWSEDYVEVYDLHRSLRTRLMKILFFVWCLTHRKSFPRWRSVSKQRLRLYLYYSLKKLCPRSFRPAAWITRFTQTVNGTGRERPNLRFLLSDEVLPAELCDRSKNPLPYICVMPSSRWDGKKWSVDSYFQVLSKSRYLPVLLGRNTDLESLKLEGLLKEKGIPYFSAVGSLSLAKTAKILQNAVCYLGSDTGLAHLAEAVGTPANVILGPTTPEMGFGPWMEQSKAIGLSLWCRPCGKDGRSCYRIFDKHRCLKGLSSEVVLKSVFFEDKNARAP